MKFFANYLVVRKLICIFASKMNSLDKEAIRVVGSIPKWIPGRQIPNSASRLTENIN